MNNNNQDCYLLPKLSGSTLDPSFTTTLFLNTSHNNSDTSLSISPTRSTKALNRKNKPTSLLITPKEQQQQDDTDSSDYSPWS